MSSSKRNSSPHPSGNGRVSVGHQAAGAPYTPAHNTKTATEVALFSADLQGSVTGCNQAFTQLSGYALQEIVGRRFTALFSLEAKSEKEDPALEKTILSAACGQGLYQSQLNIHRKSAQPVGVQLSVSLLSDGRSVPVGFIAIVTVTDGRAALGAPLAAPMPAEAVDDSSIVSREIDDTQFILASPVMHKFMGLVDRVAGHAETVLITGETGTGKELIARTIHESSHRRGRPWVDINCAALPENLVESELFGYEKGAFSGADASKPGLFELAEKGTLFRRNRRAATANAGQAAARARRATLLPPGRPSQNQSGCAHRRRH